MPVAQKSPALSRALLASGITSRYTLLQSTVVQAVSVPFGKRSRRYFIYQSQYPLATSSGVLVVLI
jgi:hypothetical protein